MMDGFAAPDSTQRETSRAAMTGSAAGSWVDSCFSSRGCVGGNDSDLCSARQACAYVLRKTAHVSRGCRVLLTDTYVVGCSCTKIRSNSPSNSPSHRCRRHCQLGGVYYTAQRRAKRLFGETTVFVTGRPFGLNWAESSLARSSYCRIPPQPLQRKVSRHTRL